MITVTLCFAQQGHVQIVRNCAYMLANFARYFDDQEGFKAHARYLVRSSPSNHLGKMSRTRGHGADLEGRRLTQNAYFDFLWFTMKVLSTEQHSLIGSRHDEINAHISCTHPHTLLLFRLSGVLLALQKIYQKPTTPTSRACCNVHVRYLD